MTKKEIRILVDIIDSNDISNASYKMISLHLHSLNSALARRRNWKMVGHQNDGRIYNGKMRFPTDNDKQAADKCWILLTGKEYPLDPVY